MLWTDESKYNLCRSDGKKYVRSPMNAQHDPKYAIKTIEHGVGSVLVWGSMSWYGPGPIVNGSDCVQEYFAKLYTSLC